MKDISLRFVLIRWTIEQRYWMLELDSIKFAIDRLLTVSISVYVHLANLITSTMKQQTRGTSGVPLVYIQSVIDYYVFTEAIRIGRFRDSDDDLLLVSRPIYSNQPRSRTAPRSLYISGIVCNCANRKNTFRSLARIFFNDKSGLLDVYFETSS